MEQMSEADKRALAAIHLRAALRSVRRLADLAEQEPDCVLYVMEMAGYAASAVTYAKEAA